MTLVYRVENKDGIGMYRGDAYNCTFKMYGQRHLAPSEDAELCDFWDDTSLAERDALRFAFATIDQLRAWIYHIGWRRALHKIGLVVSVYDAEFVHSGATQCVFKIATAKKVGELSLLALSEPIREVG